MHRNTEYSNIAYNTNNNSYLSVTKVLMYCYLVSLLCYISFLLLSALFPLLSLSNAALISAYVLTMI